MKFLQNKKTNYKWLVCLILFAVILLTITLTRAEELNPNEGVAYVSHGDIVGNHLYKVYSDDFIADAVLPTEYDEKAGIMFAKKQ